MHRKYEGSFLSEADGLPISVLALIPAEKPYRGILQLVHGMSEYKERYLPFMEYMTEQGFVTVIHDHRGHGKSVYGKKDLGYMYGGGEESILKDMLTVNRGMRERFPQMPVILFGHSMGSLAVRDFARRWDSLLDMLIVCGSPSRNSALALGTAIARCEGALLGKRHRSRFLETISFGSYVMRFRKDKSCTSWICSDNQVAQEYEENEYCGFTFTDDAYLTLFHMMKGAYDVEHWNCTNRWLPILFVSGADDPCLGNVRRFAKTVQAMRHAGYYDVKGKLYPGMRHEILNEKGKEKVFRDISLYIKKKGF
ncbi:MAG: alpha/beta hydrolase [Eubacteriales bacterium]|nr:alpha/beta hydrolase [Eubacteriales bacterium]